MHADERKEFGAPLIADSVSLHRIEKTEEFMASYFWLLVVMAIVYWFMQQRKQDERATALARQLCEQQQVQFLECARSGHKFQVINGQRRLRTLYIVDFSGDGESRYQAELWLKGLRLAAFNMPPYRL